MSEKQFLQCIHFNQIDGVNQSVPIVLPTDAAGKAAISGKDFITLVYEGKDIAIMAAPEVYDHVKEERASRTFGLNHTGQYLENDSMTVTHNANDSQCSQETVVAGGLRVHMCARGRVGACV